MVNLDSKLLDPHFKSTFRKLARDNYRYQQSFKLSHDNDVHERYYAGGDLLY